MRKGLVFVLLAFTVLGAYGQAKELALLPFTGEQTSDGKYIVSAFARQRELRGAFSKVTLVTRTTQAFLRFEQRFQRMSGLTDADTIFELGKQLNASHVMAGYITKLGTQNLVLVSVLDVESLQQIAGDYRAYKNIEEVADMIPDMARKLARYVGRDTSKLPGLSVPPFDSANGVNESDAQVLAQILAIGLANGNVYAVLPRTDSLQKVLEEHSRQRSGETDQERVKRLGAGRNARYVLAGSVQKLGDTLTAFTTDVLAMDGSFIDGYEERYQNFSQGVDLMPKLAAALNGEQPVMLSVMLRVLNYYDLTSGNWFLDAETEVWQKFKADHPNITIEREDLSIYDPFHNKVEAYAASGNLPDVLYAWPSGRSTTLYRNRLLKDLTPLVQKDGLSAYYHPLALTPSQFANNYVGILSLGLTSSHAFYVNNAVLKDAGLTPAKTYAELAAQVPVLKAKGYETVLMANKDTWVMQACLFSLIAGRFGGEGWDQKILNGQAKFTDPDFVNALRFVKQLYNDGVLSKSTFTTDYGTVTELFASKKGAYLIDGDWRVGAFITDQSTGQALISPADQEDILITVFPDIESAKLNKSTSGILGTGWGIRADIPEGSAQEAAAWELVKWLTGKEVQLWWVETGYISTPSRNDVDLSSLEPMQKAIARLPKEYSTSTSVIDGVFAGPVYTPLNDGLQAIGMGIQTPAQVAKAVQDAFDAWKASN
ncbi:MAG: extracellular solute-binding protein [Treponema sp.]|jgi:raffinose/stachyose/melibiose transport system substrate-binding protein|nr:extracellular solute-binding protein [Treponema sp.]